jgi:hypothetical protein
LGFRKAPLYPESCSEALLSVQVVARVTAEMRVRGRVMIRLTLPRASHSGDACARTRARRLTHPTFWRALPCRLAFWSKLSDRRRIVFVSIKLIGLSQNELKLSKFEYRWVDDLC